MAGYVAMTRVEPGRVRTIAWDGSVSVEAGQPQAAPTAIPAATTTLEPEDAITLGEQWDRLRDQLSMVTFYLTDPESWR